MSSYFTHVTKLCPSCIKIKFLNRDESQPEMVTDENAEKPEGWLDDEPELVPDSSSEKPSDW